MWLQHIVVSSFLGLHTGFQFCSPYYFKLGKILLLELEFSMLCFTLRECIQFFWKFFFFILWKLNLFFLLSWQWCILTNTGWQSQGWLVQSPQCPTREGETPAHSHWHLSPRSCFIFSGMPFFLFVSLTVTNHKVSLSSICSIKFFWRILVPLISLSFSADWHWFMI